MIRWIILMAVIYLVLRILLQLNPGLLKYVGRMPGDARFESGKTKIEVPVTTILIISLIITIILNFLRKLF